MAITLKPTDNVKLKNGSNVFVINKKNGTTMWRRCKPVTFYFSSNTTEFIKVVGNDTNTEVTASGTTLYLPCGDKYTFSATPKNGYQIPTKDGTLDLLDVSSLSLADFESENRTFVASFNIAISNASFFYDADESVIIVEGSNETSVTFKEIFIYFHVYQGADKGYVYVGEYHLTTTNIAPGQSFVFKTSPITSDKFDYDIDENMAQKLIIYMYPIYTINGSNKVGTNTCLYGIKANFDWAESESTTTGSVHLGDESTTSCELAIN